MTRMLLALESSTAQVIREPGFSDWLVYLLVFLVVVDRLRVWFIAPKRDISGTITTHEGRTPADKAEVEEELHRIETMCRDMQTSVRDLRDHIDRKHAEVIKAGGERAEKIMHRIDTEISTIRTAMDARCEALHEKINTNAKIISGHAAHLEDLRSRDHSHDMQLLSLRNSHSSRAK